MMSQLWDEDAASMKTPYRTLHSKLRPYTQALRERQQEREVAGLCIDCGGHGASKETLLCDRCYVETQAGIGDVIDLNEERDTRKAERMYSGEDG